MPPKDRRGVDKAWELTDVGKLPERPAMCRYYQGRLWVRDAVNGAFAIAPQGGGGGGLANYTLLSDVGEYGHDSDTYATLVSFALPVGHLRAVWSCEVKGRKDDDSALRILADGVVVAEVENFAAEKKLWFGVAGLFEATTTMGMVEIQTKGKKDTYVRNAHIEAWTV